MPPRILKDKYREVARAMFETFVEAAKPPSGESNYPQSASDVTWGIHELIRHFEIKRRPIALDWKEISGE